MMRPFFTALSFLTVLPVPQTAAAKDGELAFSMRFFPAVGFLVGLLSLALFAAAQKIFPAPLALLVLLMAPIFLSGGLHVDGFADFCDGFFSGKDKAGILRIMKDPNLGTWGVLGLALLLLSKWEALKLLPARPVFFLLAVTAARWSQVVFSRFFPYVRPEGGLGQAVARKAGNWELGIATLFLLPLLIWAGLPGLFVFVIYLFFLCLFGHFVQCRLGGVTGDVLGAVSEFSEWLILTAAVGMAFVRL